MSAQIASAPLQRRYDLDWLRVLTILVVFVFHSFRFFSSESWHVNNATTYPAVYDALRFLGAWMMPLIFVISGGSLFYALGSKGHSWGLAGKFLKDKFLRLFVPLLVNMFSLCILQVYLERYTHGQFNGSIFQFLPHYFEGIYGINGNFALVGMHLWYLAVLFLFSLLMLPLLMLLKTRLATPGLNALTKGLAIPGMIYLLAAALTLLWKLIPADSILGFDKFDWNLGVYLSYLLLGFVIFSSEPLIASLKRQRWFSLALALAVTVWYILDRGEHRDLVSISWVLALLSFGMQYLNFNKPILAYASEAVLPFYILHQTVLLCVGYFIMPLAIPDPLKWLLTAAASLATILAVYEYLVRRSAILRILFGMKLAKKSAQPAARSMGAGKPALQGR